MNSTSGITKSHEELDKRKTSQANTSEPVPTAHFPTSCAGLELLSGPLPRVAAAGAFQAAVAQNPLAKRAGRPMRRECGRRPLVAVLLGHVEGGQGVDRWRRGVGAVLEQSRHGL
jgi:hypothetical protein